MSVVNNSEKNQLKKVLGLGFGIAIELAVRSVSVF